MTFAGMWSALLPIGRDGGTGGYRRFAWTREDHTLREWFAGECATRGLDLVEDRMGNQWAWWGDPDAQGAGVVTGSHLDSVPDGGAYDGPLGVISALAAVDRLRARGIQPDRPIGIVNFVDEEGARFGVACAGSRVITGALPADRALGLRDSDGVSMAEALTAAGRRPADLGFDAEALGRVRVFVELHVEQGRGLVDQAQPVGIGTGIWPHGRWRIDFPGEANHAGTTRLEDRHDAMLGYASTVLAARDAAARHGCLATMGKVRVSPGGVNAIAGSVTGWLDARGADQAAVRQTVADIAAAAAQAGATMVEESWTSTHRVLPRPRSAGCSRRCRTRRCSAPAPATTPGSSPPSASPPPCCSSATPPACPTPPPNGRARPTAWPGSRRWPTVLADLSSVPQMTSYWSPQAWLPAGVADRVRVTVADGVITAVTVDVPPASSDVRLTGVLLPGLANGHSHAFHRGLRGRTHGDGGTFWTWRQQMYALAGRLDPDSYLHLATAVYAEMALAGYTAVGEFHYLHHDPNGQPYADPNAMGHALIEAADRAGLRLTLLDTCYLAGGLTAEGHQPLDRDQLRFGDGTVERWQDRWSQLRPTPKARIGAAIHSVRAVPAADLAAVASATTGPLHVHLSEQPAENRATQDFYGCSPTRLLADHGVLGPRTTAIHATHLTADDVELLSEYRHRVLPLPDHRT